MSLVIFFGFASLVFLAGLTVVSVTLYHWYQLKKEKKALPSWKDLQQRSTSFKLCRAESAQITKPEF